MLYIALKTLINITLSLFFNKKVIHAKSNIPKNGPLIIVANHPGTFLDPLIIAATSKRKVFFLAKGSMFSNKLVKWVFKKFNMIPVYRAQDDPSQMNQNKDTFIKCYEHLEKNGVILIFPEGVSLTEKKLKPIKTGAARIALGAEERNGFQLGVRILPIGINYENPHQFRKDVFVNIGIPIEIKNYAQDYLSDKTETSKTVTNEIQKRLSSLIIDIDDKVQEKLTDAVYKLYKTQILEEEPSLAHDKLQDFNLTKGISEAISFYAKHHKEKFNEILERIAVYNENIQLLNLNEVVFEEKKAKPPLYSRITVLFFKTVLGLPIFIYGYIHNILPFELSPLIARKINNELEYRGPISMVVGMFLYLILYISLTLLMYKFTSSFYIAILYGFSLPISGLLAYWYGQNISLIKNKWKFITLFYKRKSAISKIIVERKELIDEIEKGKEVYFAYQNSLL